MVFCFCCGENEPESSSIAGGGAGDANSNSNGDSDNNSESDSDSEAGESNTNEENTSTDGSQESTDESNSSEEDQAEQGPFLSSGIVIPEAAISPTGSMDAPQLVDLRLDIDSVIAGDEIEFEIDFIDYEMDIITLYIGFPENDTNFYQYDISQQAYLQISGRITIIDTINILTPGKYEVSVNIQDQNGNISNTLTETITVIDLN